MPTDILYKIQFGVIHLYLFSHAHKIKNSNFICINLIIQKITLILSAIYDEKCSINGCASKKLASDDASNK